MILQAKQRLTATQVLEVLAAKGDAIALRQALVNTADLFSKAVDATQRNSFTDASTNLKQAMKLVAAGAKKTFGKSVAYTKPYLEKEINSNKQLAVYGGLSVSLKSPEGKIFEFSWEFNILQAYPNKVSVWLGLDTYEYRFNGSDVSKYINFVNKTMNYFEEKGFLRDS